MQIRKKAYTHSLLALLFAPMVGCGGTGNSASTGTTTVTTAGPSGKVTQGPVSGSTVWADSLTSGTAFVIDAAEQSTQTTTSSTGTYTLPVTPSYKYVIASQGGTDTTTGKTADTLLAPGGSLIISPLTTLVALDTTGKLAATINALLPAGTTFDSDLTAAGGLTPAAMVFLTSITSAVTTFDATIQDATKSGSTLTQTQLNNVNLTLFSQMATQFAALTPAMLSNTASLATNLQASLSTAITAVAANNTNITGLSASTIATTIADNSVATAAVIVGNATGNTALQAVTAANVTTGGVTATTASTVTEATVLSSGTNTTILDNTISTVAASTSTGVTAISTPTTYTPPAIPVLTNPTVIGYSLAITASGSSWSVTSLTVTFSDDMVATTSGGTNYIHSVLNPANYTFTPAGCTPTSYATTTHVATFTCSSALPAGSFVIAIASASSTAGVWASATSLGLPVTNTKTFTLPTVTGSTGGSSLNLF